MRLWSIHPKYLDSKGLVALWRETLLAKKVLLGNTVGYKNHSQLIRFKKTNNPIEYINIYLSNIFIEAVARGYNFDKTKINIDVFSNDLIEVTTGQIKYEFMLLLNKLKSRDMKTHDKIKNMNKTIEVNQLFKEITGKVEIWEKIKSF